MSAFFAPAVQQAVTAASAAGLLTMASTTGFYPSQVGWLNNGTVSQKVKVMKVVNATTLFAQTAIDAEGTEANSAVQGGRDNRLKPATYSYSNLSAFNAGYTLYCDDQLIYGTDLGTPTPTV